MSVLDHFPDEIQREAYFALMRPLFDYVERNQPPGAMWDGMGPQQFQWDMWLYVEALTADRPKTLIELGTGQGLTCLYFAKILPPTSRVITVDKSTFDLGIQYPSNVITLRGRDTRDPMVAAEVAAMCEPPVAVFLDTEHDRQQVLDELRLWKGLVSARQLLLVEDTWIGVPQGSWRDHALGGVEAFFQENNEFAIDLWPQRWLTTQSPFGWLRRKA